MNKKVVDDSKVKELLGYQHFLYNVNIEYSPGGRCPLPANNELSFKLKCLPYMFKRENGDPLRKSSVDSCNSSSCDQPLIQDIGANLDSNFIDVTKATCAFLGNSDYVPNHKLRPKRVVLELISAKLSQPTISNVPVKSYHTSLVLLPELQDTSTSSRPTTKANQHNAPTITNSSAPTFSSKRFVNYTLLIKTAPGLDKLPAVIERRFSDFLILYQDLRSRKSYAKLLDIYVTFPKKVYMGNFSLTNIAERSIEFSRLLNLCMSNINLLWSEPFISFLMDKELKEAHRSSLCGDPDDIQSTIEIVHRIQQKLYFSGLRNLNEGNTLMSTDTSSLDSQSPILSNEASSTLDSSGTEDRISEGSRSSNNTTPTTLEPDSVTNCSRKTQEDLSTLDNIRESLPALNQRVLVTFCLMFLTYYRTENYEELKQVVQDFSQLISSQEYVNSIVNTRHYTTFRACLLFLMNMNEGGIIEEEQRLMFKRSLEDIDGAYADRISNSHQTTSSLNTTKYTRSNNTSDKSVYSPKLHRITNRDLSSLLRDRSFCSF